MNKNYSNNKLITCKRCVMDSSVNDIFFDSNGFCNYCHELIDLINQKKILGHNEYSLLPNKIREIKNASLGKKYDCIIGVSGGVDSSYVLVKAIEFGLKPLAVHMDNGWNSELAQNNISNLVQKLGVDLYTHVIDWEEYRSMMQAFFDAGVIDIELLYDNAMLAVNYSLARKYKVKFILGGTNTSTEGMRIPPEWNWFKYDKKNIKSIVKRFSKVKIKTFPLIGLTDYFVNEFILKINWISILDLMEYKKDEALNILVKNYDYKPYPYKHYESIFTRFYQGYLLHKKFGVDKRRNHLSTLIVNNQLAREAAINDLNNIPYPSSDALNEDKEYFLKKMNWSEKDLLSYINCPRKEHDEYGSSKKVWKALKSINLFLSSKFKIFPIIRPNR